MATIDLRNFQNSDGFVLHFGGRPNEVDTYTFANALVAFSDAFREINSQVNTSQTIELRLEALGPGSFRGKVKGVPKSIVDALKFAGNVAILPLLMSFIYDHYIDDDTFEIEVNDEYVIITQGGDRTIIPRDAYEASQNLPSPERVHEQMNRAIDAVEDAPSVQSFGIAINLNDDEPVIDLGEQEWANIRSNRTAAVSDPKQRVEQEEVTLSIIKVIFSKTRRKWEFVWRGVKVSAYVDDPVFLADLMSGQQKVGNGDAVRAVLDIGQEWDENDKVWLNTSYAISKVIEYIPMEQRRLFDEEP
ncbi:hypothetical protein [Cognatishimia sp. MH4019]|uniref:hypothetical protein n=1 Tax=Cognatishimia sp. MH4019 TaxID=2854030 RepID=UPI001CD4A5B0|nr:hypothetical protein [Cognatishimia sp. MH4019]